MGRFVRPIKKRGDDDDGDWMPEPRDKRRRDEAASHASSLSSVSKSFAALALPAAASALPPVFQGTLKPYQLSGVQWIRQRLAAPGVEGVILGDEMGLGKTVQSIAAFETLVAVDAMPAALLVIAPLTVTPMWKAEFARFAAHRVVHLFTEGKEARDAFIATADTWTPHGDGTVSLPPSLHVMVTSPEIFMSDAFFLTKVRFGLVVFDEAHRLRNGDSKAARLWASSFTAGGTKRLLLTGTPYHNSDLEFFTLMRMACPQALAGLAEMIDFPTGDLTALASQLMLRRLKKDVLADLPPLTEVVVKAPMSPLQHKTYRGILQRDRAALANSKTSLLNLVMDLRKCANHPYMFYGVEPEPFTMGEHLVEASGKLLLLDRLLHLLLQDGHRVLIFSQFVHMLDILQDYLAYRGYNHCRLDGSVRGDERQTVIDNFQLDSDAFVMLLSTRAGGVGITLTAADTVIFYDSDWNPQMDLQAMQRAHRIGQTRSVLVLRLCAGGTVEDAIIARAADKVKAAADALGTDSKAAVVPAADLRDIALAGAAVAARSEDAAVAEWSAAIHAIARLSLASICGGGDDIAAAPVAAEGAHSAAVGVYVYNEEDYAEQVKRGAAALKDLGSPEASPQRERQARLAALIDDDTASEGEDGSSKPPRAPRAPRALEDPEAKERAKIARREARWERAGYRSFALPRPTQSTDTPASGDATHVEHVRASLITPVATNDAASRAVILWCVNNSGTWGSGGVFRALDTLDPSVGKQYAAAKTNSDLALGSAHLIPTATGDPSACLLVCQRSGDWTIDYDLFEACLSRLRSYAMSPGAPRVSLHFPAFDRKANYSLERLIERYFGPIGVRMLRYHVPTAPAPPRAPNRLTAPAEEASYALLGFGENRDQLRAMQRLILLNGGVLTDVSTASASQGGGAPLVIVVPRPDYPIDERVVQLHEAGALIVDVTWVQRRFAAA